METSFALYVNIHIYIYIFFAIYSEQVSFQIEYNIFAEPNAVKSLVKQAKHGHTDKFEKTFYLSPILINLEVVARLP